MHIEMEIPENIFYGTRFIQIYVRGEPQLVVGEGLPKDVLADHLIQNGIPFQYEKVENTVRARLKDHDYEVVGMGLITGENRHYVLRGESKEYGIGPNSEHLTRMQEQCGNEALFKFRD